MSLKGLARMLITFNQPCSGLFLWVMFQKILCNIFNWVLWSFFCTFGKSLEEDWYNSLIEVCSQWHILNIVTLEARLLVLLFYKTSLSVSDFNEEEVSDCWSTWVENQPILFVTESLYKLLGMLTGHYSSFFKL